MAFARQFPGKAELVIAGDGPLRQELLHLASEHPDIRYAGTLPYSAMDQQMREAHWVVCSSLAEAFGMVNIEAMMNATPVIASAVGGIPEIVDNEKNGLLVFGDDEAKWASSFQKAVSLFEQQPSAYQQYRLAGREKFLLRFTRNQYLNAMTNLLVNARGL
jgi:starch synthase